MSRPAPVSRLLTRAGRSAAVRAALTLNVVILTACAGTRQADFATPEDAADALAAALDTADDAQLESIFGSDARDLLHSGDDVADAHRRELFVDKYAQSHAFHEEEAGAMTLVVGEDDWPFPVPLVRKAERWQFDTEAGRDEVLARRIGANELDAIEACLAYVDAQNEYAMRDPDADGVREYAPRFRSEPGTHNGLYWPAGADEAPSPLGPLIADAAEAGYALDDPGADRQPYFGYVYRILLAQGPHASGGAMDYMIDGRMIGGFALIARPAVYESTGIMTFMVNRDGIVYEKDLGARTSSVADAMRTFDPDPTWQRANPAPFQSVSGTEQN